MNIYNCEPARCMQCAKREEERKCECEVNESYSAVLDDVVFQSCILSTSTDIHTGQRSRRGLAAVYI